MKKILLSLFLILFTFNLYSQDTENKKDTWYIGFGVGGGDAKLGDEGVKFSDIATPLSLWFGVGWILDDYTHLGFDISAVAVIKEENDPWLGKITYHYQLNRYYGALTYFPMVEGLFFRVGGGISVYIAKTDSDYISVSNTTSGFGALAGFGYAFWIGESFNLGINFDFSYDTFSEGDIKSYQFYVSFNWF